MSSAINCFGPCFERADSVAPISSNGTSLSGRSGEKGAKQPVRPQLSSNIGVRRRPYSVPSKVGRVLVDFGIAALTACLAEATRIFSYSAHHAGVPAGVGGAVFATVVVLASRRLGLAAPERRRSLGLELLLIVEAVAAGALSLQGLLRLLGPDSSDTRTVITESLLVAAALCGCRIVARMRTRRKAQAGIHVKRVLIAGANPVGREIRNHLGSLKNPAYECVGFVLSNDSPGDLSGVGDEEVVGVLDDAVETARALFVDEIILTRRPDTPGLLSKIVDQARAMHVDLRLIPSLTESLKNRTDVELLGDVPTIAIVQNMRPVHALMAKRILDVVLASIGVLLLSPVMLAIGVAIKLQSDGPVFYRGKRVGYKGELFTCFKFRTMFQNAEAMKAQLAHMNERDGILFKITDDPRVTKVGAILRKYSLDEIPQLWNVLIGDMSLVGPRPSITTEVAQYKLPDLRRLDVIPGITGLWQVEARQDPSFETYISLDSEYVKTWSIWLDLKIILRTFTAVLSGTGA
jgi:exopolysaccharide biosynthesis polyprenyl glycosylphosphotransferase